MDRKAKWLIGLVALWAVLLGYRIATHEPQRTAPLKYTQGTTASPALGRDRDPQLHLKAELLDKPGETVGSPRNVFAPIYVYVPPPPPPPPPPAPPPPPPAPPPPPPPTEEELAAQRARAELAQYKYLVYLSRGGRDQAFVSRGGETFTAGRGDPLVGGVVLKEITPAYIILLHPPTRIELTVALSGS
jgi:hypothetical protein